MAFRSPTQSSIGPGGYYPPQVGQNPMSQMQQPADDPYAATSPTLRTKRARPLDMGNDDVNTGSVPQTAQTTVDSFIQDQEANDDVDDDDDDDGDGKKTEKKAGRRKIKIEFIQDKSRRHITFSKRKAGIMKKAYELSTLTGTQVLLLVVSETGLVYTFTTAKLQPLVTQPEGKNLIQACLNAPHGQLPNVGPGQPMNRMNAAPQSARNNVPGGLSIGGAKEEEVEGDEEEETNTPTSGKPRTRRRTSSGAVTGGLTSNNAGSKASNTSPTSPNPPPNAAPNMGMHQPGPPPPMSMNSGPGNHNQTPQPYSQQNHNAVPNVGYSNPADGAGSYMQPNHAQHGHPQMMAQYHMGQQHGPQGHPQPAPHWAPAQPQAVPQSAQYGRR